VYDDPCGTIWRACPATPVGSVLPEDRFSLRWSSAALERLPMLHPGPGPTSADNRRSAGSRQIGQTAFQ